MVATPVKIGPFVGGLNTYSPPSAVADNEFVDVLNFDIDLDGSLYSRAPFRRTDTEPELPGSGSFMLLGWYIDGTTGTCYLIGSSSSGTYVRNESTGLWSTITTTFGATCMVQYAGKAWLIANPASANPGGSWTITGFVANANLPKGTSAVVYKERLFVAGSTTNPNRVYFSDPADFTLWQKSVNFFDVRSGDGQDIVKLVIFQDTIVVFKENCTYAFAYDSAPTRGAVRLVNPAIGLTNRWCVIEHENSLYVHFIDKVYQMQNWNFTIINVKVPFFETNKWGGRVYERV